MRKDRRFEAKGLDPVTGKRKSFYSRVSQAEADRLAGLSKGRGLPESDDSFEWYAKFVFLPAIHSRSAGWQSNVAWALDKAIVPEIGRISFKALDRARVQLMFNRLSARFKSPYTVLSVYKVMAAICNLAELDGAVERSPCRKIRLPAMPSPDKTALSFEDLSRLIRASHETVRNFVLLSGCCSLRLGEACAVMRSAIDQNGDLHVKEQLLQHVGGQIERTQTLKTPGTRRRIPLPEGLATMLRAGRPSLHICSNCDGGALLPKSVRKELHAACDAAGIERVSPHELRHTFISLMENELEAPQRIVEALSGKAKSGATAGYSHTQRHQLLKWMELYWDRASRVYVSDDKLSVVK